ncbi:hypothetical protein DEM27_19685 [Metarhizobium album]|uniref:Uncharacterized protein n=1 Tax=Metarhizobium album TaxID=2182425 RepID=A0A2U2DN45_9HYPH|nr:hypothetical protein [Rhizobium album]PWE54736.1 hypothetical protein DEM27_19685 [Rhizobium album]
MSTIDDNASDNHHETDAGRPHRPHRNRTRHPAAFGVTAFAILALGAAAGAGAMKLARPGMELAPTTPVAISAMQEWSLVTVKGKVAEVFGNKFIVQDDSGRALVETGPAGDSGKLVALNEPVSVQGRFEHGFLHATYIIRQDGSVEALGPAGGPPRHGLIEDMLRHDGP